MILSVIIVNYNVKDLLRDCLISLNEASRNICCEIFVVDNNSKDNSAQMILQDFPYVHLIQNKTNTGFSSANNQAIKKAKGKYLLILNPDTIIYKNTLDYCLKFAEKQNNCGAIGVQMVDKNGLFLAESKRSFPSPSVSFYRLSGLSFLFKKSTFFNKYYLSHLDKNKNHEVDTLAGAFIWIKKSIIDQVGMFDESFFMYGEDIDLCYRIQQKGYKNFYLGQTKILHYKGESTNKLEYKYIHIFYGAMKIFAKKHFKAYFLYNFSINILIILHFIKLFFIRLVKKK
jgi:GT2 family glycosyltransferase